VTLFEAGRLEDARESFERALVLEPEHADALANLAAMPAA
jgi:Flp pilus assembly protein TadD